MKKRFFAGLCIGVFVVCLGIVPSKAQEETGGDPSVFFPEPAYTFDPVFEGAVVPHDFVIENKGKADLEIKQVEGG